MIEAQPSLIRRRQIFGCLVAILLSAPAALGKPAPMGGKTLEDEWERIYLRPEDGPPVTAAEVEVLIQTDGPRMTGLIRIPGSPASNFDTGNGKTVVDLINLGDEAKGYPEVTAVELLLDGAPNQSFMITVVGRD